jgi:4-hydroxy-tetrahydrodipicolinate synthase
MVTFARRPLEGILALSPLCLDDEQGIDYDGIRSNVEYLESQGIHGFVQLSSMGQVSAPSEAEFERLTDVCVDAADDITCVVGGSGTSQREVIDRVTYAEEAGADGTMIELPYMLPVEPEWVAPFFRDVDDALAGELAVMVYNFPPVTGCDITPEMWREELLDIGSIKAVKDSNASIDHHDRVLLEVADEINFVSKSDPTFWHDSLRGGEGYIGILAWVAPRVSVTFFEECRAGNHDDPWVREVDETIKRAFWDLRTLPDAPMISYEFAILNELAEVAGQHGGPPRLPYRPLHGAARDALEDAVEPLLELEAAL